VREHVAVVQQDPAAFSSSRMASTIVCTWVVDFPLQIRK
jgi:hypothetical protein